MDLKKQIALLTVLATFQFTNVEAAEIDNELAVIAAEQQGADVEIFKTDEQNNLPNEQEKTIDEQPSQPVVEVRSSLLLAQRRNCSRGAD